LKEARGISEKNCNITLQKDVEEQIESKNKACSNCAMCNVHNTQSLEKRVVGLGEPN